MKALLFRILCDDPPSLEAYTDDICAALLSCEGVRDAKFALNVTEDWKALLWLEETE